MTLRVTPSGLALWLLFAAAPAARAAEPASAAGRLGDAVRPTLQTLTLELDAGKPDYRGTTRIALEASQPVSAFRLHSQGLTLGKLTVSSAGRTIAARALPETAGVVEVRLDEPVDPGAFQLDIEFSNDFDTRAAGLYRLETGGNAYAFTQFESDDARSAFPCFDEPAFKIPWEVTLAVPSGHLAVSNAPVARETVAGGWKRVEFRRTPPLPSYLVAFATGPLDTVPIPGLRVPGRVVTVRGQTGLTGEAVRATPAILDALERYFGRPYPYEKLDLIAVPEFWYGAMENAGAVTFADRILLVDPRAVSVQHRYGLSSVISHELAHMWFGDLVTMKWWDDLWLNESFASWMATRIMDELHPEFAADLRSLSGRRSAMRTDARRTTRAIRQPVLATDNLLQLADELAYDKGQAVLRMIERWIGPDAFRSGVAAYLERHAWGNAEGADLWEALTEASGEDVRGTLPTFLDQPGLPLITVERLKGNRVRIKQRRFLNDGVEAPSERWRIPVVLRYGEGAAVGTRSVLLTRDSMVVRLDAAAAGEWIHPNADEAGYYRWSLPAAELEALAAGAGRLLTPRERIGFLDNLDALLDAGMVSGDLYLANLERFASDPEPDVVRGVIDGLDRTASTFVDQGLEEPFARFVRRTLRPALERFGGDARPGEPRTVPPLRVRLLLALAEHGRDPEVLARLEHEALAYLEDSTAVPADLRDAVVPAAALGGDAALFDRYVRRFERTTLPDERRRFLAALGWFRDPVLLRRALEYARQGPLQPQEIRVVPNVAARTPERREVVQRYWMEHYEDMTRRLPPMFRGFLPRIADGCSIERLEEAQRFFADPAHQAPGWEREMAEVAERVRHCVGLNAREGAAVRRFLEAGTAAP